MVQPVTDLLLDHRETRRPRRPRIRRWIGRRNALATVFLEIPHCLAICACGNFSPTCSLRINAQVFQSDDFSMVDRCSLLERHNCSIFNRRRHVQATTTYPEQGYGYSGRRDLNALPAIVTTAFTATIIVG